jgi:replicative DNA helicase
MTKLEATPTIGELVSRALEACGGSWARLMDEAKVRVGSTPVTFEAIPPNVLAEIIRTADTLPDLAPPHHGDAPMREGAVVDGATFALDGPQDEPAVWGRASEILWAAGEPMLIVGPDGVGKTTLALRLALAMAGVGDTKPLGFPVGRSDGPVLYIAADRPRQAQRSLARMIGQSDRDALRAGLLIHRGPLPFDMASDPTRLSEFARSYGSHAVVLDSLGLLVPRLAGEEAGSGVAAAFSRTVTDGIEVAVVHHQRKSTGENPKPKRLADVYGSRWITASAGSVILLWGEPGDAVVQLSHLKQPADPVGPFHVNIDHETGTMAMVEGSDLLGLLRAAPNGLTVKAVARHFEGSDERAAVERARRKLSRLVEEGRGYRRSDSGPGRVQSDVFFATAPTTESAR